MEILFLISVVFVLYTYAIYPLLLIAWGKLLPKRVEKRYEPLSLSVVLAARDEETQIQERLDNFLAQDYDHSLVEIIVVSDGSTDRTVEIAQSLGAPNIQVLELEGASGKAAALNLGLAHATSDVIVFADARQRFSENAFAELTARFHDESVGAVSGELIIRRDGQSEVGEGVGLYWQYEKLIRRMESTIDSVVGATGSIYAIRRSLFVPLPENTLLDDFLTPMRIVLQGRRVIFVRAAKAFDSVSETSAHEFARKVRTLAGNFQAFAFEKSLLNPFKNRIFFQMVSHKITRLLAPYFMITAFASNLFLSGPVYRGALIAQILFYGAVLLKFTPLVNARFGGLIRVAWTFVVMNAAAVVGLWVFVSGKDKKVWQKAQSSSSTSDSKKRNIRSTP